MVQLPEMPMVMEGLPIMEQPPAIEEPGVMEVAPPTTN
jgi:hypothetical protein